MFEDAEAFEIMKYVEFLLVSLYYLFQTERNGNWKSVRARQRVDAYFVGRGAVCRQRGIDS